LGDSGGVLSAGTPYKQDFSSKNLDFSAGAILLFDQAQPTLPRLKNAWLLHSFAKYHWRT
jgi:hypothetical protein